MHWTTFRYACAIRSYRRRVARHRSWPIRSRWPAALEPDATDLPVRAAFVPWLLDALSRRLGNDGRVIEAHPGESLVGFDGISALERPDGSLIPLSSDRLTAPNDAGVYYLRRQSARAGALVINPEPEESDLSSS